MFYPGIFNAWKTLDNFLRLWENSCEDFGVVPESNFTTPPETRQGRERPRRGERGFCKNLIKNSVFRAVADGDIPVAMWLNSACLHDSRAAIPLMQRTASLPRTLPSP